MNRRIAYVMVRIIVESSEDITENDMEDVISDMDYEMSFDDKTKKITDTEIVGLEN